MTLAAILAAMPRRRDSYVAVDIETSNRNPALMSTRPVQLGYLAFRKGRVRERGEICLDWRKVSPLAGKIVEADVELTRAGMRAKGKNFGVSIDDLRRGAHPVEAIGLYSDYLSERVAAGDAIVGFNHVHFDLPVLARAAEYNGARWSPVPGPRLVDVGMIELAALLRLGPPVPTMSLVEWYVEAGKHGRRASWSLGACAARRGIAVDESKAHGALYDCRTTHEVWQDIIREVDTDGR